MYLIVIRFTHAFLILFGGICSRSEEVGSNFDNGAISILKWGKILRIVVEFIMKLYLARAKWIFLGFKCLWPGQS